MTCFTDKSSQQPSSLKTTSRGPGSCHGALKSILSMLPEKHIMETSARLQGPHSSLNQSRIQSPPISGLRLPERREPRAAASKASVGYDPTALTMGLLLGFESEISPQAHVLKHVALHFIGETELVESL